MLDILELTLLNCVILQGDLWMHILTSEEKYVLQIWLLAYLIVKEAGGKLFSINGSELDSELGVNTTMSFLAVLDDNMFEKLACDVGIST